MKINGVGSRSAQIAADPDTIMLICLNPSVQHCPLYNKKSAILRNREHSNKYAHIYANSSKKNPFTYSEI